MSTVAQDGKSIVVRDSLRISVDPYFINVFIVIIKLEMVSRLLCSTWLTHHATHPI